MKKVCFNEKWSFHKQGDASKTVSLPHDAMLAETRSADCPSGSGGAYFPGGMYVYEKTLTIPEGAENSSYVLEFEGAYRNSTVYVNGKRAGGCKYGYLPFFAKLNGLLKAGDNTIRVEVDNSQIPNSRWYSGSGIYRPVWLWTGGEKHIDVEGVKITTLSYSPAKIRVQTSHTGGEVSVEISYNGAAVATANGCDVEIDVPNAKLWSDESPNLYQCKVILSDSGAIVDAVTENFGIRVLEWSNKGFFVNGKETYLRGGCVHHDNGILGAASYAKSEERRVRIHKSAGFNAIRSAHNPCAKGMLEACDKLGVYIMDETWDMWYKDKTKCDYAADFMDNYKDDIAALIRRDYNHPSVVMYSIGNEVAEPHEQRGIDLAREMTDLIHKLDPSRPVTAGINLMILVMAAQGIDIFAMASNQSNTEGGEASSLMFNELAGSSISDLMASAANSDGADAITSPVLDILDIAGYNYASGRYPLEAEKHPDRIVVGSETFPPDLAKNWAMVQELPYLVGDFMWTSWDYLGETGCGGWSYHEGENGFQKPYPWILAGGGAFDINGMAHASAMNAATIWGVSKSPKIMVRPVNHPGVTPARSMWRGSNGIASWSWQNCGGNAATVEVYSDADSIELILNGKSVGKQNVENFVASFEIPYQAGTITAVAYNAAGAEVSRSELTSATGALSLAVEPEDAAANVGEIVYVPVSIVGENGVVESNADTKLTVSVENCELLAFGSANPRTEECYLDGAFTTYRGRVMAIVKCTVQGTATVSVSGGGFAESAGTISVQ